MSDREMEEQSSQENQTLAQDMVRTALLRLPITFEADQLAELMSRVALTAGANTCDHQDERGHTLLRQLPMAFTASQVAELIRRSFPEGQSTCDKCKGKGIADSHEDSPMIMMQEEEESLDVDEMTSGPEQTSSTAHRTPLPSLSTRSLARSSLADQAASALALLADSSSPLSPRDRKLLYNKTRHAKRRAEGKCHRCPLPLEDDRYSECESCRARRREIQSRPDRKLRIAKRNRARRQERIEEGRCVRCGSPLESDEFTRCESCRAKGEKSRRKYIEKRKSLRAEMVRDGACSRCLGPNDKPEFMHCESCRAKERESHREKREDGRCGSCGRKVESPGGSRCDYCRAKQKEFREERAMAGKCRHCGGERESEEYKMCIKCRTVNTEKKREESRRNMDGGGCPRCGKKREDELFKYCEACRAYCADMNKIRRATSKVESNAPEPESQATL